MSGCCTNRRTQCYYVVTYDGQLTSCGLWMVIVTALSFGGMSAFELLEVARLASDDVADCCKFLSSPMTGFSALERNRYCNCI